MEDFVRTFVRAGGNVADLKIVADNPEMLGTLIKQTRAMANWQRLIKGEGPGIEVYGPEYFSIFGRNVNIVDFPPMTFSDTKLESKKETHVLFAVDEISIDEMAAIKFEYEIINRRMDKIDDFTKDKGTPKWVLISKNILGNSGIKNYEQQKKLLNSIGEIMPSPRVLMYCLIVDRLNKRLINIPNGDIIRTHVKSTINYRPGIVVNPLISHHLYHDSAAKDNLKILSAEYQPKTSQM